ncbi:transposable element tc3 transposase-like protein [Dinothrombium tinctorium]|uniref:Transposable element tc3 transposase-like protein n=1 Tax=Dinothrombium tinctorium TaxID=1965070 RepID=A0A3S4QGJ5_9ACAR|nr:transposable element tc3 transposase-like protein [Dinothrombium tinctorium]
MATKPPLKPEHLTTRLEFAKEQVTWKDEWKRVVFSDEKIFNLIRPEGFKYYWHDLRDKHLLSRRQFGGDSVMVWAAFYAPGKTRIAFIDGRMNAS